MVLGLGPSHTICVKVLGEIRDNVGLDVEGSTGETILDSLDSEGDLTEDPHLVSTIEELLTFEIRHLETEAADQVVVNQRGCWCR